MPKNNLKAVRWAQVWKTAAVVAVVYAAFAWMLKPDPIDYVNVALVPELAERLEADVTTRLELAHIGQQALRAAQGYDTRHSPGQTADADVTEFLESSGSRAFDLLSVEQRKEFYYMFRSREILPIKYHTEESDVPGVPRFYLTFGWKQHETSFRRSIEDTLSELESAWKIIPARSVASALTNHRSRIVAAAANQWLSKHSQQALTRKSGLKDDVFNKASLAPRSSHEERTRDMRRDFERRVAENRANHQRLRTRSVAQAEADKEQRSADFERRRKQMRSDHENRARQMRADHERRAAKLRADHERRAQEMRRSGSDR